MIRKDRAKAVREQQKTPQPREQTPLPIASEASEFTLLSPQPDSDNGSADTAVAHKMLMRVKGTLPPELWNRFGSKIVPKLRSAENLQARVELTAEVSPDGVIALESEIRQLLNDLEVNDRIRSCRSVDSVRPG